jgi:hypothetical protein
MPGQPVEAPQLGGALIFHLSPIEDGRLLTSEGAKEGNWVQTDPKKGWFMILRLYTPLESFFTKNS